MSGWLRVGFENIQRFYNMILADGLGEVSALVVAVFLHDRREALAKKSPLPMQRGLFRSNYLICIYQPFSVGYSTIT